MEPTNTAKIYESLKSRTAFDENTAPNQENFENWSGTIKRMSISRSKEIIADLLPLLDDETEFKLADRSKFLGFGVILHDAKPDTIKTRVCDVAFVSLLRAIGQTEYTPVGSQSQPFALTFKPDFIEDKESVGKRLNGIYPIEFNLILAEKFIKLTADSKTRIKAYVSAMK